jgi:hypothetical protein
MSWQHNSIGQITGAPPAAGDPMCFAWERDKTQHVIYRGADNQIHELWFRHGTDWKYGGALSFTAGGPPAGGDPFGYSWEGDNTQHIIYRGLDNQIHELWQRHGDKWKYGNAISAVVNAPLAASDPAGFAWEGDGTQHIIYRAQDNQIHELWQRKGKNWEHGGALSQFTGATLGAGKPFAYAWEKDGTQHVVYRGVENQIHELWQRKGQKWQHGGALSQIVGAPPAASDATCFAWEGDGTQHILYLGADNQVHEIWYRKGKNWSYGNALSQMAGAPAAASVPFGYAWESDDTQHVIYRGQDNQVHELWQRRGKNWAYGGALSQMTGGSPAVGNVAGFAWEHDRSQHVIYRGADNYIHELWQKK